MAREFRARHHKYIQIEDARDQVLDRHQQAGVPDARRVPSAAIQEAAARSLTIPVPAGTRVQDSVLVELPAEPVAASAAEPTLPPYVPVRPRGIRVSGVPNVPLTPEVMLTPFPAEVTRPITVDARVFDQAQGLRPLDTPLPIPAPDAPPEVEYTLDTLPIGKHDFEYLSGTAGCLHGETVVDYNRGARQGSRSISMAEFYRKFNGLADSHRWDLTLPTHLHSVGDDEVMFYNRVVAVFQSGVKPLVRVEFDTDSAIRATHDHPILTADGFVHAAALKEGQTVIARGTMRAVGSGGRDLSARPPRVIVNTKYHPCGSRKVIRYGTVGGSVDSTTVYNYMRVARARLVVEAALNNLPYDEYVHVLQHNPERALTLRYIPTDFEVHHVDENTLNDDLTNLQVMSKAEHARLHDQRGNFKFDSIREVKVTKITEIEEAMTYDIQMEAPANNFVANGVVVHNTGKTWLAKKLLELSTPGTVVLAATTGIASVNLGEGTTINALLGFFNTEDLQDKFTTGRLQSTLRRLRGAGLRRILLDEVSMMDARQLTVITRAIVEVNQPRDRALESVGIGGDDDEESDTRPGDIPPQIGITLVGDFAQLSPVPDTNEQTNQKIPAQYAFESPEWPRYAQHVHKLTRVRRQDNIAFVEALHAVRRGDIRAAMTFFTADKFSDMTDQNFNGTTIFSKNLEVERYNQLRLDQLSTPSMSAECRRWGKQRGDWKQIPDHLTLKVGALVMCLANRRSPETKKMIYANGDLGVLVEKISDSTWKVKLQRTGGHVFVVLQQRENLVPLSPGRRKEIKEYEQGLADLGTELSEINQELNSPPEPDEDRSNLKARAAEIAQLLKQPRPAGLGLISEDGKSEIVGTIVYMPLRCAYGATCHKSQGLTLDTVQVNIRDGFFKHPGLLFVALSRARTPEGLRIVGDPRGFMERCRVDGRVVPWL